MLRCLSKNAGSMVSSRHISFLFSVSMFTNDFRHEDFPVPLSPKNEIVLFAGMSSKSSLIAGQTHQNYSDKNCNISNCNALIINALDLLMLDKFRIFIV